MNVEPFSNLIKSQVEAIGSFTSNDKKNFRKFVNKNKDIIADYFDSYNFKDLKESCIKVQDPQDDCLIHCQKDNLHLINLSAQARKRLLSDSSVATLPYFKDLKDMKGSLCDDFFSTGYWSVIETSNRHYTMNEMDRMIFPTLVSMASAASYYKHKYDINIFLTTSFDLRLIYPEILMKWEGDFQIGIIATQEALEERVSQISLTGNPLNQFSIELKKTRYTIDIVKVQR